MSKGVVEPWFNNEIVAGIGRLSVLNMPFTPAVDTIEKLTNTWVNVLWLDNVDWCERRDPVRIRKAFRLLMTNMDRFPTPAQFKYYLPERVLEDKRLPAPTMSIEERKEMLAKMKAEMRSIFKTT